MIKNDSDYKSDDKEKGTLFLSFSDHKAFVREATKSVMTNSTSKHTGVGPGSYNLDRHNFTHMLGSRPLSIKGYVIGARTAERCMNCIKDTTPDPGAYQNIEIKSLQQAKVPFNTAAKRFRSTISADIPGVGSYDCDNKGCKRVQYQQSFGRNPVCLPSIKQLSSIKSNTNKLSSTTAEKRYNRRLAYLSLFY